MLKINRRGFIGKSATGLGGLLAMSHIPSLLRAQGAINVPIGFQTFSIRNMLGKDFAESLKTMADFGYQLVAMCSPGGYADNGFGFLTNMKTADIKSVITDAGLSCPSCHFGFGELT